MNREYNELKEEFCKYIKLSGKNNNDTEIKDMCKLQEEGIILANKILENKNSLMIADDVGLGKTYEGLGIIFSKLESRKKQNILIIAPNEQIGKKWISEYNNFRENCYIKDNKNNIPETCNDFLDNPFELLKIKDDEKNHISVIRANKFSYIQNIIKDKEKDIINLVKEEDKEILEKNIEIINSIIEMSKEEKDTIDNIDNENEQQKLINQLLEVLKILNKYLREFDLVIIDESQNLRGEEQTLKNKFLNYFFGLYRFKTPNDMKFRKSVLLTATPDHSEPEDIFRQFQYIEKNKELVELNSQKKSQDVIEFLEKFDDYNENQPEKLSIIRRSRKFNGQEKYAFRKFKGIPVESSFLEKMTFAVLHKKIINENKNLCDMRYIDGFESFLPNEKNKKNYDEDGRENRKEKEKDTFYLTKLIDELKNKRSNNKSSKSKTNSRNIKT